MKLEVLNGPLQGHFHEVKGQTPLGRGDTNTLRIEDYAVSLTHCLIFFDGNIPRLMDLNSSNGTTVNDIPVNDTRLLNGDVIEIGKTLIRVHLFSPSAKQPRFSSRVRKRIFCVHAPALWRQVHCTGGRIAILSTNRRIRCCIGILTVMIVALVTVRRFLPNQLWMEYKHNPENHPLIPNCSYAGYRYGETVLPEPGVLVSIRECGAKGDGISDDTFAFKRALYAVELSGGGVILVPAGIYRVTEVLTIDLSSTVLRGEGPEKSIILFEKSLGQLFGSQNYWSWKGGLIRVEPRHSLQEIVLTAPVQVAGKATQGAFVVETEPRVFDDPVAAEIYSKTGPYKLTVGTPIMMSWEGGRNLAEHIYGSRTSEQIDWEKWLLFTKGKLHYEYPNEIVKIDGTRLTLKKPLRIDIRQDWKVIVGPWKCIQEVGIENLTIRMPIHKRPGHLKDPGFNGIFMIGAMHCWIRNVTIENSDNGVVLERSSHVTLSGLKIAGETCHHATSWRYRSHDNLMTDFIVSARPHHGLSCQDLSSGNVWTRGVMEHGTLDSHCGMPFDSIRTNIKFMNCDGGGGGARTSGPFVGRRIVHWNIELVEKGRHKGAGLFTNPAQYSMGATVGVQGVPVISQANGLWHMPPGNKGTVVSDVGRLPRPLDLYEAQLKLRQKNP